MPPSAPAAPARLLRPAALAAALPLALTACGPDLGSLRSAPIPDEAPRLADADLPPEPGEDAPFADRIEWDLVAAASRFARVADPDAAAECPEFDTGADSELVCTVVFRGTEAEWEVTVNGGDYFASSQMRPLGRQVVRDVAEDLVRFEMDTETVRCDMDEVHVIPTEAGEGEPVTCAWGRDRDSWRTEGREGTVRIEVSTPHAGQGGGEEFWLSPVE
ncbi:hypothetical protein [Streptomonospora nanhaiensis]|uniref:DUF4333 domain-containing protein n=1 Tax=Streptomonospora nanhaiensis TaxID=1323731 RepID=A0A853BKA7_9ACTN|nr:hypothetical protein [Streptomonospora nanhaiensis]MBV2364190.1 hypothetical protein [Streptomonospora nanhaiensis]NYI95144.1 hypothetical protein [Streptomonospora nanhaiensis]